jgi:NADH:ubiquinone oxidoreductase subunit F (NADH-binding)
MPDATALLIETVTQAGLTGRGGGGFSCGRKLGAVVGRNPVAVANGAEGEPLSRKDHVLLNRAPHLVLDGLNAAAAAIGADSVYLYVSASAVPAVAHALEQRRVAGLDPLQVSVIEAPDTFVAGEESAVVRRIENGPALPRDRTVVAAISGVRRRPTLINNVETLAHVALIARFGPRWFQAVGERADPGSMLVTLTGNLNTRAVIEVPTGVSLGDLIRHGGATDPRSARAVLVGGYHGSWIPADAFGAVRMAGAGAGSSAVSRGAGVVYAVAPDECGLACTADIVGYLAGQSARQCGPCHNGLPRLAELCADVAHTRVSDGLVKEVYRIARLIEGRGACRHPDGTVRLVRSALRAFATDLDHHRHGRCEAAEVAVSAIPSNRPPHETRTVPT